MPSLGRPGAGTATISPEEVSEGLPQPPRPQLRQGRLQQLRASLSLRLGSLDPGWLQRCDSGTLEACQPIVGAEEPQPLTSGVPGVLGPSTGLEAPLQGSEAPESVQGAVACAGSPPYGNSQGKKRSRRGELEGSPAPAQEDSSQLGPLPEGPGDTALVQAQPPSGLAVSRYHSLSLPARLP